MSCCARRGSACLQFSGQGRPAHPRIPPMQWEPGSRSIIRCGCALAIGASTLIASGCTTLPNGKGWGEDATFTPGWERVRTAAAGAAKDPWVVGATDRRRRVPDRQLGSTYVGLGLVSTHRCSARSQMQIAGAMTFEMRPRSHTMRRYWQLRAGPMAAIGL